MFGSESQWIAGIFENINLKGLNLRCCTVVKLALKLRRMVSRMWMYEGAPFNSQCPNINKH